MQIISDGVFQQNVHKTPERTSIDWNRSGLSKLRAKFTSFHLFFFFWALLNGPLSCAILSNWWKDHWSGTRLRKLIWILRRNAMHFTVLYQCNESIEHIYIETKLQILKFDCLQTLKKQMVLFRCCCLKSWLFEDRNDKRSDDESYLSLIKIIFIIHSVSDRLAS